MQERLDSIRPGTQKLVQEIVRNLLSLEKKQPGHLLPIENYRFDDIIIKTSRYELAVVQDHSVRL